MGTPPPLMAYPVTLIRMSGGVYGNIFAFRPHKARSHDTGGGCPKALYDQPGIPQTIRGRREASGPYPSVGWDQPWGLGN